MQDIGSRGIQAAFGFSRGQRKVAVKGPLVLK